MKMIIRTFVALNLAFAFWGTTSLFAAEAQGNTPALTGKVIADGSSTVFLISEAVGEEFQKANRNVKVAVAVSGTGGGFKKFCLGELDFTGASRPIEASEMEACKKSKIDFVELPVAYDGIALVTSKSNSWAKSLSLDELKKIWEPGSKIQSWNQVRSDFPAQKLALYGPGHDSGTFDFFTKVVVGKEKSSRADFTASEDDNVLVKGIEGEKGALGYFGFAYYEANRDKLNLVAVGTSAEKAIAPSFDNIAKGIYRPLSRPLFIYVSVKSLDRPEVKAFANYYVSSAPNLARQVGYVELNKAIMASVQKRLDAKIPGSLFSGTDPNLTVEAVLAKKK